jgi:AAA+ ATPase superfamily predicted ATPase
LYAEKHAHMPVVMGRRRVGKTRSIKDASEGNYFFVGLMKKIFTEEKEPLYGRITARIDLKPLKYEFMRGRGFEHRTP